MPAIDSVPPAVERAQRDRHELADRREQDRGVERLRRRVGRVARARAAELEREPLRVASERVSTCTVAPSCSAICAARCADAPKP